MKSNAPRTPQNSSRPCGRDSIRFLAFSGLFAAVIFVVTEIHIPSYNGYTHVGDGILYLAACLLPTPYAMVAGAVGAALADCLSGSYMIWAPGTILIKAVTALFFTSKKQRILCRRNLFALLPAAALCAGGYYLYEVLVITHSLAASLAGVPGYLTQSVLSSVLFLLLGAAMDKTSLKKHYFDGGKLG